MLILKVQVVQLSNVYHIETVNYDSILCTSCKFCPNYYFTVLYITGVYDQVYSVVHLMKYLESDVCGINIYLYVYIL